MAAGRGLTVGEWVREVVLLASGRAEPATPTEETRVRNPLTPNAWATKRNTKWRIREPYCPTNI